MKFDFKMDAVFGIIGSIATINEKIIFDKFSKNKIFLIKLLLTKITIECSLVEK